MNHGLGNTKKFMELFKLDTGKELGEDIHDHIKSGNVVELDMTRENCLTNKMEMNVDVFGASMEHSVLERVMIGCFLELQEMVPSLMKNANPEIE
ncbi:hypothetical protein C0995_005639 [Termitomyces sp. Mi166|nr:hypothetical protein C0995_005639 [Termitomyces sp. Mi166\